MKGRSFLLILGIILVIASFPVRWYGTGGPGTPLEFDDPRVLETISLLREATIHRRLATDGALEMAWLSNISDGYKVNPIININDYPWRASYVFSSDGEPVSDEVSIATGILLPVYFQKVGIALLGLWLIVGFLGPRLFAKKCPDCPGTFLHPAYLEVDETYAYPGGFDANGDSLSPIVKRVYNCPCCGYRYDKYFVALEGRAGRIWRIPMSAFPRVSANVEDELQKYLDRWFSEHPKIARFKTYDEWKAYYNELKASEGEQPRSRVV